MSHTAIVTISCPHCGGRTDGVRSIESPQTLPCPYCRTELHVPRVGERVIERERIIERVVEVPPREREPPNPLAVFLFAVAIGVLLLILVALNGTASPYAPSDAPTWEQTQQQRAACKETCKASCPTSSETVSQLLERDAVYSSDAFDRAFAHDRCATDCDLRCLGIEPTKR